MPVTKSRWACTCDRGNKLLKVHWAPDIYVLIICSMWFCSVVVLKLGYTGRSLGEILKRLMTVSLPRQAEVIDLGYRLASGGLIAPQVIKICSQVWENCFNWINSSWSGIMHLHTLHLQPHPFYTTRLSTTGPKNTVGTCSNILFLNPKPRSFQLHRSGTGLRNVLNF